MKKKLVLIGYGGMGKQHLKRIQKSKLTDIIGVYDNDLNKNYNDLSEQVKIYTSFEEVLNDKHVDAVLLAVPNNLHKELAISALKADKHVICEKPVTLNSLELQEILSIAKQTGKVFMVHQNRRWDENFLIIKQLLAEEKLGEIYYIENRVQGSRGIPKDWRQSKSQGGGMLLDWGVHLIDRILFLFPNQKVTSISTVLNYFLNHEVDDGFRLELQFESGKRAFLEVGTSNFVELPEWYVTGSVGTAVIEDFELNGKYVTLTGELTKEAVPIETGAGLTKTMAPRTDGSIRTHSLPVIQSDVSEFYDNFATTINHQTQQIVKNEEVLRVMKLIDAAFASSESGKRVYFKNGL